MDLASSYKVNMNFPNFFKKQNFQPKKKSFAKNKNSRKEMFCKENLFQGKEYLNLLRKGFFFFFFLKQRRKVFEKSFWKKSFVNDFILFYSEGEFSKNLLQRKRVQKENFFAKKKFFKENISRKNFCKYFFSRVEFSKKKKKKRRKSFFQKKK